MATAIEVIETSLSIKDLDRNKNVVEFPGVNLNRSSSVNAYFEPRLFKWQRTVTDNGRIYDPVLTRNRYWRALDYPSAGNKTDMYGIGFANVGVIGFRGVTLGTDNGQYFLDFSKFVDQDTLKNYVTRTELAGEISGAIPTVSYSSLIVNNGDKQLISYNTTSAVTVDFAESFVPLTGTSGMSGTIAWKRNKAAAYYHALGKMTGCIRVDVPTTSMSSAWHSIVSVGRTPDDAAEPSARKLTSDTMATVGATYGNAMSLGFCEVNVDTAGDYAGLQMYEAGLTDNTISALHVWDFKEKRWNIRGAAYWYDKATFNGEVIFNKPVTFHSTITFDTTPVFPNGAQVKTLTLKNGSADLAVFNGTKDVTLDIANVTNSFIPKTYIDVTNGYWGKIPVVGLSDGVMEIGKYIDFHTTATRDVDYNVRLEVSDDGSLTVKAKDTNNTVTTSSLYAGSFYESSDERLKENIKTPQKSAKDVEIKEFNFKNSASTKYGVIAQELEKLGLDNLVSTDKDGMKSVDYISLLMLMVKDLREEIEELKKKI